MAESEGFEPSVRYQRNTRFPVVLLKPLGQLSAKQAQFIILKLCCQEIFQGVAGGMKILFIGT